ncbi:ABC transporter ATP-binding protein [Lacibacter sp.]|uniref:ABC transporter ATP-binding protein n=1 Tax=Lacibacter sp. TaxID=1915409 RepID=UPI002B4B055F|nr:ABC transporter ATP-binding protein [Lacibacter sp.]HLP36106.1 ABC transporter ATP-binding protein [Lacibacter sp.]
MSNTVIKVENISKQYRLGTVSTGTLSHDLNRWWHTVRGKEDPYLMIGDTNDRTKKGSSEYVWALKDISFDVKQGDVLGIIGRNGAGKSTLLKILSRTTTPSTGSIKIKGRVASLLEVGTGFHPELSGRDNIFLNGAILGMTKDEIKRKFDEIVDFAGVERYIDTPVKRYSSGMYVRLAFAVAAYLEPEILIVDEVLAVGDAEFQKKALGKMKDVSNTQGRTVLFVSHNMAAVQSLCTTGILLENGTVTVNGPIEHVIDKYHLSNRGETEKYKIWNEADRPANPWCKILSVELVNLADEKSENISTDDNFVVNIQYQTLKSDSRVGLTIMISDINDVIVFSSINNHEKNYYSKLMPNGEYKTTCKIPSNFLNNGNYNLSLIVFGPNFTDPLHLKNVLTFEILDGFIVRGDFHGTYGGLTRPMLQWETIKNTKQ